MRTRIVAVWLLAALGTSLLAGCSSSRSRYATAREAYDAEAYRDALDLAEDEARRSSGPRQESAELIAGMSARNLKNTAEAERYLKPLTTSADPLIAGRANVEMGIIESQRGRHESAARYFDDAGDKLPGDEAGRALFQAGESCAAAGRTEMAKLYYRRALDKSSDAALRSTIESRLSFAGFTLQVGAFASRINADKAVAKAQPQAQRLGLDGPRVVTRNGPNGRALYVVQMGTFNSQRDAELARAKAGPGTVVARVTTN